jgi:hypothetical protein
LREPKIDTFNAMPRHTLDIDFLSLQTAMTDSLRFNGGNNYKLRHMNKAKLRKAGLLPKSVRCDPNLILDCIQDGTRLCFFS